MTNHRITVIGTTERCQARCTCKHNSPIGNRGDMEGWIYAHNEEVARIRAHLGSRTPSLRSQQAWFVKQAENTDNPIDDRYLWRQLADEVERHIAHQAPVLQTETLF